MAIALGDNLDYKGPKPDIARQQYELISDLASVKDVRMPQMYLAYCLEDEKVYLYNKNNEVDETTGKFREFTTGSSTQYYTMPDASSSTVGSVIQYIGESDGTYNQGWFYIGKFENTEETLPVETVEKLKELINSSTDTIILKFSDESEVETEVFINESTGYFVSGGIIYSGTILNSVVTTLDELKSLIESSETTATVKIDDETEVESKIFTYNEVAYYVYEDIVYSGTNVENVITHSESTAISTDEEVAALGIVTKTYIEFNTETSPKYETDEEVAALGLEYTNVVTSYFFENLTVSPSSGEPATITIEEIDELFE